MKRFFKTKEEEKLRHHLSWLAIKEKKTCLVDWASANAVLCVCVCVCVCCLWYLCMDNKTDTHKKKRKTLRSAPMGTASSIYSMACLLAYYSDHSTDQAMFWAMLASSTPPPPQLQHNRSPRHQSEEEKKNDSPMYRFVCLLACWLLLVLGRKKKLRRNHIPQDIFTSMSRCLFVVF